MIQIGGVYTTFCQEEGIVSQKYRDRNGRCITILFKKIGVDSTLLNGIPSSTDPEGPRIEKIQSREALLKKSSFQYGMKFSIENGFFFPGPSLTAEKQGPGLKFSLENDNFKPRMKISSENENFVRGGMAFSCVRARMIFFNLRALWGGHF